MHTDISRESFDKKNHYLRVVQEQGAVLLDADANEQTAILLHRLHTLANDLFGPAWGPNGKNDSQGLGFGITFKAGDKDFTVSPGRYYVGGRLCENEAEVKFTEQPDYPVLPDPKMNWKDPFVVYLDVWEATEHVGPDGIDPALLAITPSPRTRVVWQVKVLQKGGMATNDLAGAEPDVAIQTLLNLLGTTTTTGRLAARSRPAVDGDGAARLGGYQGMENQLYRVEIHRGGEPCPAGTKLTKKDDLSKYATFKWSRDNGSVTVPLAIDATVVSWQPAASTFTFPVKLAAAGRDDRTSLRMGDWVEYVDAAVALAPLSLERTPIRQLFQVAAIDAYDSTTVTLKASSAAAVPLPVVPHGAFRSAFLRRWDFTPGEPVPDAAHPLPREASGYPPPADDRALLLLVPADDAKDPDGWLELEDGVQVRFESKTQYAVGDSWLIPARTGRENVLWPIDEDAVPKLLSGVGGVHVYAPLAVVTPGAAAGSEAVDCRRRIANAVLTEIVKK
jgi:Family of unknown function (DUF6519)